MMRINRAYILIAGMFFAFSVTAEDAKPQPVPLGFSAELPDDFQGLSILRKKVVALQAGLEEELGKLQNERRYYPQSKDSINDQIESLTGRIMQDKKSVEALEKKEKLSGDESKRLESLKYYIPEDERSIKRYQQDIVKIDELENKIADVNQQIKTIDNYVIPIEQKISNLLNIEDERNEFRKLMSITFCILVAIVIIGFYVIAIKKEAIAESIFSGEKGIQFVTIFLIVIAIILFGVMGVLESKELSALLGGLSGFILGRVSTTKNP